MNPLNISEDWQNKFDLLNKIGASEHFIYKAMSSAEYKALNFKEKNAISFNFLAFLFGTIYYFSKKMWAKGAVILAATWMLATLLTLVEVVGEISIPSIFYWIPTAVICAQLANYDYYRNAIHGEKMWRGMPNILSKPIGAVGLPLIVLGLLVGISTLSPNYVAEMDSEILDDVSGIWRGETAGEIVVISIGGKAKTLTVNNKQITVTIKSIDHNNSIITIGANLVNGEETWAIRKIYDDNSNFTLQLTLHNGTQDDLSFVSNLIEVSTPITSKANIDPVVSVPEIAAGDPLSGGSISRNFTSASGVSLSLIRDRSGTFSVFTSTSGACIGELSDLDGSGLGAKGGLLKNDKCTLVLQFENRKVAIVEGQSCGDLHGMACAFDGTFIED